MATTTYHPEFFANTESLDSANEIIPLIKSFVQPNSVLDVGCSNGAWLSAWEKNGVKDILGLDGDYIKKDNLLVDPKYFIETDLEKTFDTGRTFDIVTCLEVAEHIRPAFAATLVDSISRCGDLVLFSAAIPDQEGTGHYNEQFPAYWIELFGKKDFKPFDCLRDTIWNNEKIGWWYRQNIFFFVRNSAIDRYPAITNRQPGILPLVHPELLKKKQQRIDQFEKTMGNPFRAVTYLARRYFNAISHRIKGGKNKNAL